MKKLRYAILGGERMHIADYNDPIVRNVRKIISEKGLKQLAVAKKAGFTANAFSTMLTGKKLIKPCDILRIAAALDVDVNELFKKGGD